MKRPTATRLGIYCPGAGTGGPWRYVHSLLAGLDPAEFDATVFCDLPGRYDPRPWVKVVPLGGPADRPAGAAAPPPVRSDLRARSALTHLAPTAVRIWAGFGKTVRRVARLLHQHPVELFHTQNTGCEESPVAAKVAGVPAVIGTFHVNSSLDLHRVRSGPTHRLLEMLSNRCLDTAIAVSRATKQDWVRRTHIPAAGVVAIHNGIDPETFRRRHTRAEARARLGLPTDAVIVGGLGRLDEAKGFAYLIAAAAQLRGQFPNLFVAIAGEGPLRESLEAEAERFGVSDRVRFLGFQSDVQPVLDALDVF
ncbi:MAG TPA: glycosyltransferase, partial [Gemmataceae bacterium]|nr:glycosyltransferase [Gemmataceae bacterium]